MVARRAEEDDDEDDGGGEIRRVAVEHEPVLVVRIHTRALWWRHDEVGLGVKGVGVE